VGIGYPWVWVPIAGLCSSLTYSSSLMKTWIQSDFKFKRGWQAGHTLERIC